MPRVLHVKYFYLVSEIANLFSRFLEILQCLEYDEANLFWAQLVDFTSKIGQGLQ